MENGSIKIATGTNILGQRNEHVVLIFHVFFSLFVLQIFSIHFSTAYKSYYAKNKSQIFFSYLAGLL